MSEIDQLDRDAQPTDVPYRTREASIDISSLPSTDTELLTHLRRPGPHVRGCWALDAALGQS